MIAKKLLTTIAFAFVLLFSGCATDDFIEIDGVCPLVVSTVPENNATGVPLNQVITATFNEIMNASTISKTSFTISDNGALIDGTVTYSGLTATFTPTSPLDENTKYTGTIKTSAKDLKGNALQEDYVWTFTTLETFSVVVSSSPVLGGVTTGAGRFNQGAPVTVKAVPNTNYSFVNWTENGIVVSPLANYTFVIVGNRTLVANYIPNLFAINLSSNPAIGGLTSGAGSFDFGSSRTVTATPNANYTFTNWTENGTVVSTNASYTFVLNANKTLVANFTIIPQFAIILSANPAIGGSTSGAGSFNVGTSRTVTATPTIPGYTFVNWTEAGVEVSTTQSYTFVLNANKTLVANFIANLYTITLSSNPTIGGLTSGAGSFSFGSSKTVTATPTIPGYTFVNWTEAGVEVSTTPSYTFILNANKTLVANFIANLYTITLSSNPAIGGSTSGAGSFSFGSSRTVTATPTIPGYTFKNWTEAGVEVSTTPSYTFVLNANKTLVANFIANLYTITLSSNPAIGGSTSGAGSFSFGSSRTVTATPTIPGYTFKNWTEAGVEVSTTPSYTFVLNANKTLVANFSPVAITYTLNVTAVNGTVNKNPVSPYNNSTYNDGTIVTLIPTPNSGYEFLSWSGDASGTANPLTVIMNSNKNITANFTAIVIPPSGPLAINLDCAAPYAVLAGSTITSTGLSIINGDVGLSAGSALVGFPPGIINGIKQITTPEAAAAKLCLTAAFLDGQGRSVNRQPLAGQLGGLTLTPGLYSNSSTSGISGTGTNGILTLDAQGNANAVWIFQIGSTLTTSPATSIVLARGAQAKNIFWIVGTSATLGTTSVFYGNILAMQSITLNTGAVLNGRALTQIAAVTLDASIINKP
ncbi:MAG: InlB B-repeat-containing protein [Lutibacter sp.]